MNCVKPVRIYKNLDRREFPDGLEVPCGKCFNCRVQKRTEWSLRLWHELSLWDDSVFLTLSYDNKHVPINDYFQTYLEKRDMQLFLKRLRKAIQPRKLKYFLCGEYGAWFDELDKKGRPGKARPHYHLILFGIGLKEEDKKIIKDCWRLCDWKTQKDKDVFGLVEPNSINYVCKYIDKNLSGDLLADKYYAIGKTNVFRLTSMGHGKEFVIKNSKQIIDNKCMTHKGKYKSIPRYYLKIMDTDITEIKEFAKEKEINKVYDILGIHYSRDEIYKFGTKDDILKVEDAITNSNKQLARNRIKKQELKSRT